jgi:peptidoglycan/LPS O-acetylase OafA/YrhL
MTASALASAQATSRRGRPGRVRAAVVGVGAAALGAAPHVLHHVGPLAGAALLAGATGRLLFGALGFLLAVPMLRRLRRRSGSWRVPGGALALMAVVFAFSSFVVGPALTGGDEPAAPAKNLPSTPAGVSPQEHEAHHR